MGVGEYTVLNWEHDATTPPVTSMPAIIRFLGYEPFKLATTLREHMQAYRWRNGLSITEAARQIGVDESSWSQWERTGLIPWVRYRTLIDEFLAHGGRR